VLAAYRLLVRGESVADARAELERFHAGRNGESKLAKFLDDHLEQIGQGLIAAGVIERLPEPTPTIASL
jgi:hypothetical protein